MIKGEWFKTYTPETLPEKFEIIFQSWDTANKATELADYSVCTTWGFKSKNLFLLHVFRKKLDYPALKQAVRDQAQQWNVKNVIIEDKASGTQLIQELVYEGMHGVKKYDPEIKEKIMRMHAASSTIENGFVHLPEQAEWLAAYLHELKTFPLGKNDDQVDSTSQALDWIRLRYYGPGMGIYWYYMQKYDEAAARGEVPPRPDLADF